MEVSRYTNIVYIWNYLLLIYSVYIGNYLVLIYIYIYIYIENLFSTVCLFFSHIFWSVNCMSWVPQIFTDMLVNWGKICIWGLELLSFKEISFPTFWCFYCIFHRVCKLFKGFFQPRCWSVNSTSWVIELCNIFRRYPEAQV